MTLVVDASMTLSWYFDGEQSAHGDAILERIGATQAFVPGIWPLEIANSLRSGLRRLPLATLDTQLKTAAEAAAVEIA